MGGKLRFNGQEMEIFITRPLVGLPFRGDPRDIHNRISRSFFSASFSSEQQLFNVVWKAIRAIVCSVRETTSDLFLFPWRITIEKSWLKLSAWRGAKLKEEFGCLHTSGLRVGFFPMSLIPGLSIAVLELRLYFRPS